MNIETQNGISIVRVDLLSPDAQQLIAALNEELSSMYPEDGANHFRLDPGEVAEGCGAFFIASSAGKPVGCGAIRKIDADTGEVKRMYVDPNRRGTGLGRMILNVIEAEARALGISTLLLETGLRQLAAMSLYNHAGFSDIPPFGEYVGSPLTICMAKLL